jgi:hypothetical protein
VFAIAPMAPLLHAASIRFLVAILAIVGENVAKDATCRGASDGNEGVALRQNGTGGTAQARAKRGVGGFSVGRHGTACDPECYDADQGQSGELAA